MLAGPLALTSANLAGRPDAVNAQQVLDALGERVDLVLDDGPCRFGVPSSVVRVQGNRYKILLAGVVPEKTLQRLASLMISLSARAIPAAAPWPRRLPEIAVQATGVRTRRVGGPGRVGHVGGHRGPWEAVPARKRSRSCPHGRTSATMKRSR